MVGGTGFDHSGRGWESEVQGGGIKAGSSLPIELGYYTDSSHHEGTKGTKGTKVLARGRVRRPRAFGGISWGTTRRSKRCSTEKDQATRAVVVREGPRIPSCPSCLRGDQKSKPRSPKAATPAPVPAQSPSAAPGPSPPSPPTPSQPRSPPQSRPPPEPSTRPPPAPPSGS
jgi:hypothetical protein